MVSVFFVDDDDDWWFCFLCDLWVFVFGFIVADLTGGRQEEDRIRDEKGIPSKSA